MKEPEIEEEMIDTNILPFLAHDLESADTEIRFRKKREYEENDIKPSFVTQEEINYIQEIPLLNGIFFFLLFI